MRSEIKCKESYSKAILNAGKKCPYRNRRKMKDRVHLFSKTFIFIRGSNLQKYKYASIFTSYVHIE